MSVAASFSRAAAGYDAHAQVQVAMAEWLGEWLPEGRAGRCGRALEVGAGTGIFTRRAMPWCGEYVATDLSATMCAEGRERVPEVEWRTMAAETPPPGPWDAILTSSMLQWCADPVATLRAWREVLAPGGVVSAGVFVAETLPELRGLTDGWSPVDWRTSEAWRAAVKGAGLRLRRDEVATRRFRHASARELLRSLHGVGAAPERRVPAGRLRAWVEARAGAEMISTWGFYRFEAERAA